MERDKRRGKLRLELPADLADWLDEEQAALGLLTMHATVLHILRIERRRGREKSRQRSCADRRRARLKQGTELAAR